MGITRGSPRRLRRLSAVIVLSAFLGGQGTASFASAEPANPLGVFLLPEHFTIQQRVDTATELGAAYLRSYPVLLQTWDGECPECPLVEEAGLQLVLTIRNTGDIHEPGTAPADLDAYREAVGRVVDVFQPALVAVENEENAPSFYAGGVAQYGSQVQVACQATHSRGVACTNGGLLSNTVKYFVYQHYVDAGQEERAASYARAAFGESNKAPTQTRRSRDGIRSTARRFQRFLDALVPAGIDYLNIHWYQGTGGALKRTVRLLRRVTGLPVISNEIGQADRDPDTTRDLLTAAVDLRMPFVVWYGRNLVNRDGSLPSTGQAYRSVARSQ